MESISRISNMLETARDLTLEAARDATTVRRSNRSIPPTQLKKLLDSSKDGDKLEGLRRVTAMSYQRLPTSQYFSAVVKNVASPNLEIKRLVYAYIVTHAEESPDTTLLAINTIQKSLSDSNPTLRALALRTMSSIRVPVISQIVALGIKRGAADMSPYVRRAAAMAIPKCYNLDPNTQPLLEEQLSILLGDKQYFVAGPAVMAFLELCPERTDLIHPHYRSLVRKMVDMDEWGQLATLRLMMIYARRCFPRRKKTVKKVVTAPKKPTVEKGFYDDSDPEPEDEADAPTEEVVVMDTDLLLLLRAAQPLLKSRCSAVIVAVARCYLYLADETWLDQTIGPLMSLLRAASDIRDVALYNIVQICLLRPQAFVQYTSHFLLQAGDKPLTQELKLEMLTLIFGHAPASTQSLILAELSHFSHCSEPDLVGAAVEAIGRCAQSASTSEQSTRCLHLLLDQLSASDMNLVATSLDVIRRLIQIDPNAHRKTIVRLAKNLDTLTAPAARASIIWLVGEFAALDNDNNIAADVLRLLVQGFANETVAVKQQIVLLAAKVYLHYLNAKKQTALQQQQSHDNGTNGIEDSEEGHAEDFYQPSDNTADPIPTLWQHVILLVRYDTSYDLRDRTRLYRSLLSSPKSTELASLLLLAPKPIPQAPSPSSTRKGYTLGSASLVVGPDAGASGLRGYETLPPWVKEGYEPDARLREESSVPVYGETVKRELTAAERLDSARDKDPRIPKKVNGVNERSLDAWLDEEEEEAATESSEESEEEEETESEYESEEGSSEEETESEDEAENVRLVR